MHVTPSSLTTVRSAAGIDGTSTPPGTAFMAAPNSTRWLARVRTSVGLTQPVGSALAMRSISIESPAASCAAVAPTTYTVHCWFPLARNTNRSVVAFGSSPLGSAAHAGRPGRADADAIHCHRDRIDARRIRRARAAGIEHAKAGNQRRRRDAAARRGIDRIDCVVNAGVEDLRRSTVTSDGARENQSQPVHPGPSHRPC